MKIGVPRPYISAVKPSPKRDPETQLALERWSLYRMNVVRANRSDRTNREASSNRCLLPQRGWRMLRRRLDCSVALGERLQPPHETHRKRL